ncbi:MAG: hypothetical protein ACLGIS_16285 [Actinomycetes bacterium]
MAVTPTPTYDTIARALAPHTGHGPAEGLISLNVAVRVAAEAVERRFATSVQVADDQDRRLEALRNEVGRLQVEGAAEVAALAAERDEERRRAAQAVREAQDALRASTARLEALERVYVMAAARWDYEGGPEPLRAALEACRVG